MNTVRSDFHVPERQEQPFVWSMVNVPPPKRYGAIKAKLANPKHASKSKLPLPDRKPKKYRYPAGKVIVVDRTAQTVKAYQNNVLLHTFECVLGRIMNRTPTGCQYTVTDKVPDHESREFPGAKMHWAVFFDLYRGLALHQYHGNTSALEWLRLRSMQAISGSAGCVRLKEVDAKVIYAFADKYTTKVWVVDRPPERGGCAAGLDPRNWLGFL